MRKIYKIATIIGMIAIISLAWTPYLLGKNVTKNYVNNIGSDNTGYVTKDVYFSNTQSSNKIAVITGIHPREKIAIDPMKAAIKNYALNNNIEITDYDIHVLEDPEDFTVGRFNGEELAAHYIVPDIKKSDYMMVIIIHAHEQGYGEGFYIATPYMDNKSVEMAQNIPNMIPSFRYYKSNQTTIKSSSAIKVSDPIAESGTPTFVYEIPEESTVENATDMTNILLDAFRKEIT